MRGERDPRGDDSPRVHDDAAAKQHPSAPHRKPCVRRYERVRIAEGRGWARYAWQRVAP